MELAPDFISRLVGAVPVAPLSSATVTGRLALQLTVTCAVALSAVLSSEALPKFMLVADTPHWLATIADAENVAVAIVVVPALAKAAQVACEAVSQ